MLGPVEARYAIHVGDRDPYRVVDDAFLPLFTVKAPGGGSLAPEGEALVVDGGEVSAVRRVPGAVEVRVFNPSGTAVSVGFGARSGWTVDLRGRPLAAFQGQVELSPWEIATVRLPDGDQP